MARFQLPKQIRKWLPDAVVHGETDYNDYLRALAHCDVHLSPFRFGGTSGNIDSMRLRIPMVTLEGREVHGQTDSGMMRAVGMPEWLIAKSIVEFESAELQLIENDDQRLSLAHQLLSVDIESAFFDRVGHRSSQDFLDAFWSIYTNHEAIEESGTRYSSIDDRKNLEWKY